MGGKLKLHVVWMTSKLTARSERAHTTRSDIRLLLLLFSRLVVELCIAWNKQGYEVVHQAPLYRDKASTAARQDLSLSSTSQPKCQE